MEILGPIIGAVNAIFMGILLFHMNNAARTREKRDSDVSDSLKQVSTDLKQLNDAVLGQYVRKAEVDALLEGIRNDLKEESANRRESDRIITETQHRFELSLATSGIALKEPAAK